MRIAALIIGVIGGIFGLLSVVFGFAIAGIGNATEAEGAGTMMNLVFAGLFFCLLGFLGAGLAMAKPLAGAIILLVSALGALISMSFFAIIVSPLFLIAAILAFFGRNSGAERVTIEAPPPDGQGGSSRVR
jgi:hypothetical protein